MENVRITAIKKDLRFATSKPQFTLKRGVYRNLFGEVRYRLAIHLTRLEKLGQIQIEPIAQEVIDAAASEFRKVRAKVKADGLDRKGLQQALRATLETLSTPSSTIESIIPDDAPEGGTKKGDAVVTSVVVTSKPKKKAKKKAKPPAVVTPEVTEEEAPPVVVTPPEEEDDDSDILAFLEGDQDDDQDLTQVPHQE